MTERNWREAKIPQWAKDSIEKELERSALSWPSDPDPIPLPFEWGPYDRLTGEPVPGEYWCFHGWTVHHVFIRKAEGRTWKAWEFSRDGEKWTDSIQRGPLFQTSRDAHLAHLWAKCRECARELSIIRSRSEVQP